MALELGATLKEESRGSSLLDMYYLPYLSPTDSSIPIERGFIPFRYDEYINQALRISIIIERTLLTESFRKFFDENTIPYFLSINDKIYGFLDAFNIGIRRFTLDIYDLGEENFNELKPYIEVSVNIEDVNEMLDIWRKTIEFLEGEYGRDLLDKIDIFFTRT